jgi:hypothetical protein
MAKAYSTDMRQRLIGRMESGASRREAAEHCGGDLGEVLSRDRPMCRQTTWWEHIAAGKTCGRFDGADRGGLI